MASFFERLQHAWNAFSNPINPNSKEFYGMTSSYRPDRMRYTRGNERSIVNAVYTRMAMDVSLIDLKHVRLDENGRYSEDMDSYLNDCLTTEANIDQTAKAFLQDICMSMFDEGCVAVVPVETVGDPLRTGSFDISSMRTAKILEWMPKHVKVRIYNEKTGNKEELILPKKMVAIIENPLYSIMNEQNSTMQRLIRKLNLLDVVDEQTSAGKLDMIIQLPYVIKTEARREQAEQRRKDIEQQLAGSKYGIAYTDGTEHITQLNRSLENNIMSEVEYLTSMLYSQLGITTEILNGTASDEIMTNYNTRTIEPIICAIADEMKRKFLTKTARTQGQTILFFRDPFKLVPVTKMADLADKLTRNEILSSNEVRQIIGRKPSNDPKADELSNKNINHSPEESVAAVPGMEQAPVEGEQMDPNQQYADEPPVDEGQYHDEQQV